FLFLPRPRSFTVWWPWVKNYYGEISVSARRDAPVWARAWIDQDLKKSMGF
ncbi:MAG: transporter substrate-binding protein, partial [Burkholderiales bacterium]|nr:transporter substrate-binding protein [Burkholderiales bacterium]